jgi:hypothetical protein
MILNAGFRTNELRDALGRSDVKMRDAWAFVWAGKATTESLCRHGSLPNFADAKSNDILLQP